MPFPGLNIDNLPFFAVIAATAEGKTIIHDWVYENRAIYLTELNRARRPTCSCSTRTGSSSRARPAGAASRSSARRRCVRRSASCSACWPRAGESVLRDVYVINRGYEDLANRLNALGANIEVFRD